MPLFKAGLPELEFDGGELAPQHLDEEVPAPAGRLQEAGVNPLALSFDEIEHRLDHPRGGEHLPVVSNALLGLDQVHGPVHFWRFLIVDISGQQKANREPVVSAIQYSALFASHTKRASS